jgi:hypothetical protein
LGSQGIGDYYQEANVMKEINQVKLEHLELEHRLSQLSIGSAPDLHIMRRASSLISEASLPSFSRFFVIKSYSEADLHKAVKYKVWSSTAKGNLVLD